jgi:hypothetical protein
MDNTKDNNINNDDILMKHRMDLHIAEYVALTNRATYFINIQNILLTVLVTWIIVIATFLNNTQSEKFSKFEFFFICWGSLMGAHLIAIINAIFSDKNYTIVKYIENNLKKKVDIIIKSYPKKNVKETEGKEEGFWEYETFLINGRNKARNVGVLAVEYLAVILSIIIFSGITFYRFKNWGYLDWLGFIINLGLLIVLSVQTRRYEKLRPRKAI